MTTIGTRLYSGGGKDGAPAGSAIVRAIDSGVVSFLKRREALPSQRASAASAMVPDLKAHYENVCTSEQYAKMFHPGVDDQ
jgi:hypothetical protein